MEKQKRIRFVYAAILLILCLGAAFFFTSKRITTISETFCFQTLRHSTQQFVKEIRNSVKADRKLLEATAELIATQDEIVTSKTVKILSVFEGSNMFSDIEILMPNDQLFLTNGDTVDVSGILSFAEEEAKGPHISKRETGLKDNGSMVLRSFVPIVQNGKTTALLIGVIDLQKMSQLYSVDAFDGEAQIYIIEGKNRNFILDTWHDSLISIDTLGKRKIKSGYQLEKIKEDLFTGQAGQCVSFSEKSGEYFYANYEPVGINDWMAIISVHESIALADARKIRNLLYLLAGIEGFILAAYFLWLLYVMRQEAKEKENELTRIQYILDVEKTLFNAPRKPEFIEKALSQISKMLQADCAFLVVPDSEKQNYFWKNYNSTVDKQWLTLTFSGLYGELLEKGHLLSYHLESTQWCSAKDLNDFRKYGINSLMVIPVKNRENQQIGVLGVANFHHHWKTTELLDSVVLSFAMAISNMESFWTIKKMGMIDDLTGLLNRNSFHQAMEAHEKGEDNTLACVYVDADGLHEINNQYGHSSGDHMLQTVADALKGEFGTENTYRIGGDEFIVFCSGLNDKQVSEKVQNIENSVAAHSYHISVGVEWRCSVPLIYELVKQAEQKMYQAKRRYYKNRDSEQQSREMNHQLEALLTEKRDLDIFRSALASKYLGVYIVNLSLDTMRSIYIPPYFEKAMQAAGNKFSTALYFYVHEQVSTEYRDIFLQHLDFAQLGKRLAVGEEPELSYQKMDGSCLKMRIYRSPDYSDKKKECIWSFEAKECN